MPTSADDQPAVLSDTCNTAGNCTQHYLSIVQLSSKCAPLKVVQECPCKYPLDVEVITLDGLAGIVEVSMVELNAVGVMECLRMVTGST